MTAQSRIRDFFAAQMRGGQIQAGQQLPTEAEISAQFSVSRATVQAAMSRLAIEGWIERFPGKGTFAKAHADRRHLNIDIHNIQSFEDEAAIGGDSVTYRLISFVREAATERVARHLGISPGASVFALKRLRQVDSACIGSEKRYFSPRLSLKIDAVALDTAPVHQLIEDQLGLKIGRIDAQLYASVASDADASLLGVAAGAPLLVRSHTIFSVEGDVILFGRSVYVSPFAFNYSAQITS